MAKSYLHILRATAGCLAITLCLQTTAHAGDTAVHSYYGKNVSAADIIVRFLGDCGTGQDTAGCSDTLGAATAPTFAEFRTRGIRIRGEESKQLESGPIHKQRPQVTQVSKSAPAGGAVDKSGPAQQKAGNCPNTASQVALPINFALNSAILEADAYAKLRQMGQAMKSAVLGSCKFAVEGHTDASGGADLNLRLSKERAYAVREFLVSMDIEPSRLTPIGKGEADPLDGSNPRAPENRRVQFRIVSN